MGQTTLPVLDKNNLGRVCHARLRIRKAKLFILDTIRISMGRRRRLLEVRKCMGQRKRVIAAKYMGHIELDQDKCVGPSKE